MIQGKPVEKDKIYYVGTNDYLANGGDNMNFFKKGIQKFDLDYKLRNILIDYFKEVDTIAVINDTRITVE
ncbi:bifunctional 2',3'-cyclic nucleotide 2'-phosphodiesterase/3'-nucleotidase precursor protein [compost metagenome]